MGLDMYLEKINKDVYEYIDSDLKEIKQSDPMLYKRLKPYIKNRGKYFNWESLSEEVAYWRKANQIHRWFVENIQNGVDNCEYYEVEEEQLEELLNICKTVAEHWIYVKMPIKNGERFNEETQQWEPMYEQGEQIVNIDEIKELLPTANGFFFGSTNYDTYYMEDITSTIEQLTEVLNTTDWENETIFYRASW